MAEGADNASKTEEPTQRRLEEARKKGDVAKSTEVGPFAAMAAACAVVLIAGPAICRGAADALLPFIAHPDGFDLSAQGGVRVLHLAMLAAAPAAAVMGAAALAGGAGQLLQQGFVWAPAKLAPDASKLNPLEGLKRIVGLDNLVNFAKSAVKLLVVAAACWMAVKPHARELEGLAALDPAAVLPLAFDLLRGLVMAVLVATGLIAGADAIWTRIRFVQRMRMSREEVKEEQKDQDGDPHIKAKLKQQRAERSRRRMTQAVPKATLVVMNPTHYAVALRYVQGETAAPECVAKGVDALALKIREIAEAHGIAVVEDPPLARALYAAVEVDRVIPREHYQAVARLIGAILSAGRRAPARGAAPSLAGARAGL
ncbi:MAG: flagellar biosynthesis protein FlhB [Caulobacteraceae bacterium]|nr:flagellar biosynthesis protein FlhB [Caulobacter sp.]